MTESRGSLLKLLHQHTLWLTVSVAIGCSASNSGSPDADADASDSMSASSDGSVPDSGNDGGGSKDGAVEPVDGGVDSGFDDVHVLGLFADPVRVPVRFGRCVPIKLLLDDGSTRHSRAGEVAAQPASGVGTATWIECDGVAIQGLDQGTHLVTLKAGDATGTLRVSVGPIEEGQFHCFVDGVVPGVGVTLPVTTTASGAVSPDPADITLKVTPEDSRLLQRRGFESAYERQPWIADIAPITSEPAELACTLSDDSGTELVRSTQSILAVPPASSTDGLVPSEIVLNGLDWWRQVLTPGECKGFELRMQRLSAPPEVHAFRPDFSTMSRGTRSGSDWCPPSSGPVVVSASKAGTEFIREFWVGDTLPSSVAGRVTGAMERVTEPASESVLVTVPVEVIATVAGQEFVIGSSTLLALSTIRVSVGGDDWSLGIPGTNAELQVSVTSAGLIIELADPTGETKLEALDAWAQKLKGAEVTLGIQYPLLPQARWAPPTWSIVFEVP